VVVTISPRSRGVFLTPVSKFVSRDILLLVHVPKELADHQEESVLFSCPNLRQPFIDTPSLVMIGASDHRSPFIQQLDGRSTF
jgi:hypothetical protein